MLKEISEQYEDKVTSINNIKINNIDTKISGKNGLQNEEKLTIPEQKYLPVFDKEVNIHVEPINVLKSKSIEIQNTFKYVQEMLFFNKLGPIAFVAPELGRWSTIGGLGIMVDELSIGLAELGEDVMCISPYYEKNRKGETGYLEKY